MCFGSNGQEKADYSRGVLERFTRHALIDFGPNAHVKTIGTPRMINFVPSPHFPIYFDGCYSANENGTLINPHYHSKPVSIKKIVINHYHTKSKEEYRNRKSNFLSPGESFSRYERQFESHDRNDEFDDGILRYRAERAKNFRPPDKAHADERLFSALASNLSPTLVPTTPPQFYAGKMETFLTCRAVAAYLQTKLTDNKPAKFFEEASLVATLRTIASGGMTFADVRLLLSELPNLLTLPYPVVNDLRGACLKIIPQMMEVMQLNKLWKDYSDLDYINRLLQTWK